MRVLVPLAEGFEEMELVSVVDILRRAKVDVSVVSIGANVCQKGAHGISLCGDVRLSDISSSGAFEGIILPGGLGGMEALRKEKRVLEIVSEFNKRGKLVASICASAAVLEAAGILEGRKFTCYPGFEGARTRESEKVVVDKNLITSQGPSTAIEFALAIVGYLKGEAERKKLEKELLLAG